MALTGREMRPCWPQKVAVCMRILTECFEPQYVAVVTGGRAENTCLLREHFDYIFFTGSQSVGKEVMRNAAEHLTPVTLELGGKSPCIVDQTADIRLAAKRIVFGKYLNCGQTCVAPDYVYCHRSVKDRLIKEVQKQIRRQYGKQPLHNSDYGKIINEKHFDRILGLIDEKKVVHGGGSDRSALRIEPTVMDNVTFSDAVMQEEIFGPIMPILVFDSLDEVIRRINSMPHPLALYIFTSDKKTARKVYRLFCSFGEAEIIPEKLMDAVVGISGSSPAYVYMMIEAMADAAVADGMPRAQAYTIKKQDLQLDSGNFFTILCTTLSRQNRVQPPLC